MIVIILLKYSIEFYNSSIVGFCKRIPQLIINQQRFWTLLISSSTQPARPQLACVVLEHVRSEPLRRRRDSDGIAMVHGWPISWWNGSRKKIMIVSVNHNDKKNIIYTNIYHKMSIKYHNMIIMMINIGYTIKWS